MDTFMISSHTKYHMPRSSDSLALATIQKAKENFLKAAILLLYLDLSIFSPVLQVLLCLLLPRRHSLLSTSCHTISCVLLITTSTPSRHPLHGCLRVCFLSGVETKLSLFTP
jgi:hypothetical protein